MKITFRTLFILILTATLLASCGSKKKISTRKKQKTTKVTKPSRKKEAPIATTETAEKETQTIIPTYTDNVVSYVELYAADAMKEMKLYKIPASITLAQGILESGSGKGRLAMEANNHFGVKCHTGWNGGKIYHDDDASQECFRKYKDASYSYRDHSLFLTERSRYSKLFKLDEDDYEGWAKGLRDAGYATDRRYPEKLISLIERYDLHKYDEQVLGRPSSRSRSRVALNPSTQIEHKVEKGDTLYNIAKKHNTTVDHIKRLNSLSGNTISIGNMLVIEPDSK